MSRKSTFPLPKKQDYPHAPADFFSDVLFSDPEKFKIKRGETRVENGHVYSQAVILGLERHHVIGYGRHPQEVN